MKRKSLEYASDSADEEVPPKHQVLKFVTEVLLYLLLLWLIWHFFGPFPR
jgi:hypothetical protein